MLVSTNIVSLASMKSLEGRKSLKYISPFKKVKSATKIVLLISSLHVYRG